ncbi:MAG: hypothetical protein KIH69_012395 [Anaerolineae bacterium]|nr:hypothetical protein [Anaerolineae bacterium]
MQTVTYQDLVAELQGLSKSQWEVAFQMLRMIRTQNAFNDLKGGIRQPSASKDGQPASSLRAWANITQLAGDALTDSQNMYE